MKFTSIFYTASEVYIRALAQITNKRAENMKFTSIFYTASEVYIRAKGVNSPNKRTHNTPHPTNKAPNFHISSKNIIFATTLKNNKL